MLILLIKAGQLNKMFFFQISQFSFIILVTDFFHFDNLIKGNDFKCVFSPENGQYWLKRCIVLPSSFDKEK